MVKPNFFIVGAPKCGTTSLYTYLKEHPNVFMPSKKEPFYFGSDLAKENQLSRQEYLSLFSAAQDEKRIGEASTGYLHSEKAAREIYEFNPYSKIIVMLRNPIDLMYSLYHYRVWQGIEQLPTFKDALKAEHEKDDAGRLYRGHAYYMPQIKRYLSVFGEENLHIIILDDLKNDPEKVYTKVLRFLDLDDIQEIDFRQENKAKKPTSDVLHQFITQPPSWVSKSLSAFIPENIRHKIFAFIRSLNSTTKTYEPMNPSLRRELEQEFEPEINKLSELLDRDLTHWVRSN